MNLSILQNTSSEKGIEALQELYADITVKQTEWLKKAPLFHCPPGCPTCCTVFEPDVLPLEALYVALFLIENRYDIVQSIIDTPVISLSIVPITEKISCPFLNTKSQFCCSIYESRPLICRLFGYCGDINQEQKIRFKLCRFHPLSQQHCAESYQLEEAEMQERFGALPPPMSDFGMKLISLHGGDIFQKSQLVSKAVANALQKILLLQRFAS